MTMQTQDCENSCPECKVPLVDGGEEMVCPRCGMVEAKEYFDPPSTAEDLQTARQALGSYMGTLRMTQKERATRGVAGSNSRYEYLKVLSDFAGRDEGPAEACDRIIRRVAEKLFLPRVVQEEASSVARTVLASHRNHRRVTLAAVSAFSLVAACRIERVTSVSVREIIAAHTALGRKVDSSSFIQLALESPIKIQPRRPEDYIGRVLARLSSDRGLSGRLSSRGVSQTSYFNSLRETANQLLLEVKAIDLSGRRPCALAAAAVYSAEVALSALELRKKRLTQRLVAECGDAAEYTIREQCATIFAPAASTLTLRTRRALPPVAAR
jgi:transcription initiation factor TFIIIB Brf1 subunit/transcription initiation factor TFIIB